MRCLPDRYRRRRSRARAPRLPGSGRWISLPCFACALMAGHCAPLSLAQSVSGNRLATTVSGNALDRPHSWCSKNRKFSFFGERVGCHSLEGFRSISRLRIHHPRNGGCELGHAWLRRGSSEEPVELEGATRVSSGPCGHAEIRLHRRWSAGSSSSSSSRCRAAFTAKGRCCELPMHSHSQGQHKRRSCRRQVPFGHPVQGSAHQTSQVTDRGRIAPCGASVWETTGKQRWQVIDAHASESA
jgi:hypothetical protein